MLFQGLDASEMQFFFSIPYFLCTANVFFNYFSLFALQMWVTFFNFSTANVFKFLFFFTANVHHFLYTLLKLLPVKCCLKFFSPRPPLRSSLGKLKNNFRGGGAQKKRTFFSLFLILGLCFFFLFYCLCTIPNPTISQGYSSYKSGHFHTYKWPFWMDTGLFSNRFLTFPSKSCTKNCFKPGKDR
mgnify:CR=1 FL=1